jgi:Ca-activated chloride channel family protein
MRTKCRTHKRLEVSLVLACIVALAAGLAAPAAAQQDPAEELAANIIIPHSRTYAYTTQQQGAVRITRVDATIHIVEAAAQTTLDISLQNTTSTRQEAELIIPIADDAVVSGFAYDGTSDQVTAEVLPRAEAERIYNQLVSKIRDPALAEFIGYNLIGTSVFPIQPNGQQKIHLTYEHVLRTDGNRVDYCLPRTESLQYEVPWKITVSIESSRPISSVYSPSHLIYTSRTSPTQLIAITDPDAEFTPGPFLLSYLPEGEGINVSMLAYPDETADDTGYFLLLAGLPAKRPEDVNAIKRELTLVLDRSGSMAGEKIRQAQEAAVQVVSALDTGEAFNVIIYNDVIAQMSPQPVIKDSAMETKAHSYIRATNASGGTNLHGALQTALAQPPMEGMLPLVLFLTDGLPTSGITSETAIRDLVLTANPFERRVFTFGVGYDLNAVLLDGLAQLSRARSFFVLPGENVEVAVTNVFKNLTGPVFADGTLRVLSATGSEAVGRTQDILPVVLPDLFEGDRLVLLGRYIGAEPLTFEFSGNFLGKPRTFAHTFAFDRPDKDNGFIPRLWASRKIAELIDAIRQLGADPTVTQDDPRITELAGTIIDLSTQFGIITEYTAFLAREGTNLSDAAQLLGQATNTLYNTGAATRDGSGAVSQSMNLAMQRAQDVLNMDSSYLNSQMERTRIVNAQQANDLTFYFKDGRWIDSRLAEIQAIVTPHRTVEFGSDEFFEIADRLADQNRQGALAFAQDILLLVDGEIVLIDIPAEVEEEYQPVDPRTTDQGSGTTAPPMRAGR